MFASLGRALRPHARRVAAAAGVTAAGIGFAAANPALCDKALGSVKLIKDEGTTLRCVPRVFSLLLTGPLLLARPCCFAMLCAHPNRHSD